MSEKVPQGVQAYFERFYFDATLSPSPAALSALQNLVDPSHILFGSDFPFATAIVSSMQAQELEISAVLDDATRTRIDRDNALELFPGLAGSVEETS